jgi:hypothetical protein
VSALINLTVADYYERGGTRWLRFQEKRGKEHEVPVRDFSFVTMFPRVSWNQLSLAANFREGSSHLYDGRGESETLLWLPKQRALVFADAHGARRRVACLGDAVAFRARPAGIARAA